MMSQIKIGMQFKRDMRINKSIKQYKKEKYVGNRRLNITYQKASNHCKRVLEAAKLAYATKTKESITSQKLGSRDFWRIANSVFNKGKSAIPPLFDCPEVLSSASDKAKCFAENFRKWFVDLNPRKT